MPDVLDRFEPFLEHIVDDRFTRPAAEAFVLENRNRHREPWRKYHIVDHFVDVGNYVLANADEVTKLRATLLIAISHDEIYIPEAPKGVNEERTAQLVEVQLEPYVPEDEVAFVAAGVRASAEHRWDGVDTDLAVFLDGDMKILGAPDDEFEAYDDNIEREFSFAAVPKPELYISGRHKFLKRLAMEPRLFHTDAAHQAFNNQARVNIGRKAVELAARMPQLQLQDWDDMILMLCERYKIEA